MPEPTGPSVIHDLGYQRYTGPRHGRRYVAGSLYAHGMRAAFGLGRSAKAKVFPWFVVAVIMIVAVVVTAVRAQVGQVVLAYHELPQMLVVLLVLFGAVVGSELVSRDLRSGVLPLYFSRPLRRADYALARWAALASALFLAVGAGQLVMFLGAAFDAGSMRAVWDEFLAFAGGVGYTALYAVVFGSVSVYIASLVSRRAVAAGLVAAVFLVSTPIVAVLALLPSTTANQLAGLVSPATLVMGAGDWVFGRNGAESDIGDWGPLYGAVTVALSGLCVALLLARYRRVAVR
ncbi:MAG TPA: ABC transporter permease subunit [Pilimelia sp.]|nr:ABC transporter permease subunit [Pilimelia sp.]